jgi:hypothetical protein
MFFVVEFWNVGGNSDFHQGKWRVFLLYIYC